jgi:membrane protease YdiL (CAAX protease family)
MYMADATAAPTDTRGSGDSPARAVLVALGLGVLGPLLAFGLTLPVGVLALTLEPPFIVTLALGLIAGQYLAFGGLALGYLRFRDMDLAAIREYLGVRMPDVKGFVLVIGGWLLIFLLLIVIGLIVQYVGAQPAENEIGQVAEDLPSIIPPLIVAMFLVVGPSEEILYRGVVQGRLREALSAAPAIIVASAIFAAVHLGALTGGLNARLTTVAILFVPSLVFGAIYEYTDNLVVPALLHGLHNSVLLALLWVQIEYGPEMQNAVLAVVPRALGF